MNQKNSIMKYMVYCGEKTVTKTVTVQYVSKTEVCSLTKYVKCHLWKVAVCLSYAQDAWWVRVKIVSMEIALVNTPTQFSPYILEIQLTTFVFLLMLLFMYFITIFFIVFLFLLDATDQNSLCDMLVMKCKYLHGKERRRIKFYVWLIILSLWHI
jgi:hypothetical protein